VALCYRRRLPLCVRSAQPSDKANSRRISNSLTLFGRVRRTVTHTRDNRTDYCWLCTDCWFCCLRYSNFMQLGEILFRVPNRSWVTRAQGSGGSFFLGKQTDRQTEQTDRKTDWLKGRQTDWLNGRQTGWLTDLMIKTAGNKVIIEQLIRAEVEIKFSNCTEPQSLFPCSHEPAICPCPETAGSSPHHLILFLHYSLI
jgi:hypothetical protein